MSEQNKALARRFYEETFNKKNFNAIDDICEAGIIDHSAIPGQAAGVKGLKDTFSMYLKAFPDTQVKVEQLIAEGDVVVARISGSGTHRGEIFGTPATGKQLRFHGIDIIRVRNGKVAEVWHQGDEMVGLMQIGIRMPAPPA